ncbi:MAG: DUF2254 domain-containing protein [Acidimicrobiia bacterium]
MSSPASMPGKLFGRLGLSSLAERLRASLFFVPMLAVVAAALFGLLMLAIDRNVDTAVSSYPLGFTSTVESARTLLATIAGATISFAGIAFSVSLLVIQLASSQYSPRVVHTLFRDRFNKNVMALVVGTFTYCVVVLRSVRSAVDPTGEAVIPNLAVVVAVLLGIVTILMTVAFINHSAHSMDISEIVGRIQRATIEQIRSGWTPSDPHSQPAVSSLAPTMVVKADRSGWVRQIDAGALLAALPRGGTARVETYAGRFMIEGTALVSVAAYGDEEEIRNGMLAAFAVGNTRTMQQDVTYGLRQLVDITVKALSPGINDPTTAQDSIFRTTAVLAELLVRDPPSKVVVDDARCVVFAEQPAHDDLVRLAFDEPRRAAAPHPAVCSYLLTSLASLVEVLSSADLGARTIELRRQALLVIDGCARQPSLAPEDIAELRKAYERRFSAL